MNPVFSFFEDNNSIYYEEPAADQGSWNFSLASKGDTRKVTTLKAKVDKVRKEQDIKLVRSTISVLLLAYRVTRIVLG